MASWSSFWVNSKDLQRQVRKSKWMKNWCLITKLSIGKIVSSLPGRKIISITTIAEWALYRRKRFKSSRVNQKGPSTNWSLGYPRTEYSMTHAECLITAICLHLRSLTKLNRLRSYLRSESSLMSCSSVLTMPICPRASVKISALQTRVNSKILIMFDRPI